MVSSRWGGREGVLTSGQDREGLGTGLRENRGHPASWYCSPLTPYQAKHTAGSCLLEPPTTALNIVSAASGGWDAKLGERSDSPSGVGRGGGEGGWVGEVSKPLRRPPTTQAHPCQVSLSLCSPWA